MLKCKLSCILLPLPIATGNSTTLHVQYPEKDRDRGGAVVLFFILAKRTTTMIFYDLPVIIGLLRNERIVR